MRQKSLVWCESTGKHLNQKQGQTVLRRIDMRHKFWTAAVQTQVYLQEALTSDRTSDMSMEHESAECEWCLDRGSA